MNKIHSLSKITTLADLDIFSVPPTQLSIDKTYVTEHRPIATLDERNLIEFIITPAIDEYILLRETMLYMKVKVDLVKTGTPNTVTPDEWLKVCPVNNFLHSLFKTVDLEINGKSITLNPQTYAYKAYLETALGYTRDAQRGYLAAQGYFIDDNKKEEISINQNFLIKPGSLPATSSGQGISVDLMGKLCLDLAQQPKALLGGMKLKFTLHPNSSAFYLQKDPTLTDITPTIKFESAILYVSKCKVIPEIVEAHNIALSRATVKYPISRGHVKSFNVLKNQSDVMLDNVVIGQIPRRIIVGLVKDKAFSGDLDENPFNFKHFNLNYLAANVNGIQYPSIAFTPDFPNQLYLREYLSVYETLNQLNTDASYSVDRFWYDNGNVLYGFNFSNDSTDDCYSAGYVNPIKQGTLNLHMKFSTAPTDNINVIVYCEFDNLIEIDANRNVITDYV